MVQRRVQETLLSPQEACYQFFQASRTLHTTLPDKEFLTNPVLETGASGLFALGMYHSLATNEQIAIRMLHQSEVQAPDAHVVDVAALSWLARLEIVHYTGYSFEKDLVTFLKETKLRPEYAYPNDVNIICHWLGVHQNIDWFDVSKKIEQLTPKNPLFVVVCLDEISKQFELVQLYPKLTISRFTVPEIISSQAQVDAVA